MCVLCIHNKNIELSIFTKTGTVNDRKIHSMLIIFILCVDFVILLNQKKNSQQRHSILFR